MIWSEESGEGVGVWNLRKLSKKDLIEVGNAEVEIRDAVCFLLIFFDREWSRRFYWIIWDLVIECFGSHRRCKLWLPGGYYDEIRCIRNELEVAERRIAEKFYSIIVWRSRELLNADNNWITRRKVKEEIGVREGRRWRNDLATFSLDGCMRSGATKTMCRTKMVFVDALIGHREIRRMMETKWNNDQDGNDEETKAYNWVREQYNHTGRELLCQIHYHNMKKTRDQTEADQFDNPDGPKEVKRSIVKSPSLQSDSSDITQFEFDSPGAELDIPDVVESENMSEPGMSDPAQSVPWSHKVGMSDLIPSMPVTQTSETELAETLAKTEFNTELDETPANGA
jgi:hypothetical protein